MILCHDREKNCGVNKCKHIKIVGDEHRAHRSAVLALRRVSIAMHEAMHVDYELSHHQVILNRT